MRTCLRVLTCLTRRCAEQVHANRIQWNCLEQCGLFLCVCSRYGWLHERHQSLALIRLKLERPSHGPGVMSTIRTFWTRADDNDSPNRCQRHLKGRIKGDAVRGGVEWIGGRPGNESARMMKLTTGGSIGGASSSISTQQVSDNCPPR